jgi:hypothetical protein
MIKNDEKYWSPSGAITPGGPSIWHVIVHDQRRLISVKMDEEQDSEDTALAYLKKSIKKIPFDAVQAYFSPEGKLISTSTDPEDDNTYCIYYPSVDELQRVNNTNTQRIQTIVRSELEEIDRLGPDVDLVTYPISSKGRGNKVWVTHTVVVCSCSLIVRIVRLQVLLSPPIQRLDLG